jgi:hypothetical protein
MGSMSEALAMPVKQPARPPERAAAAAPAADPRLRASRVEQAGRSPEAEGPAGIAHRPRRLADFEPFGRAERVLLRSLARGDIARVSLQRPPQASAAFSVRASLLAFLARSATSSAGGASRSLQLVGAWITGRLDLAGADVVPSIWLYRCVFDQPLELDGLRLAGHLSLRGCELPGLHAERCELRGDLRLDAGTVVHSEVRLRSARIHGDLLLARARLAVRPAGSRSVVRPLVADGAHVRGDVRMVDGVHAIGEMRWVGARVDGDFDARRARLTGHVDPQGLRRDALNLDRIQVGGDLLLSDGFAAAGAVRAVRALVGGSVDCSEATFDMAGDSTWSDDASALRLDRASIGGALVLRGLPAPIAAASLEDVRVSTLDDDDSTWDEQLVLDGFEYQRLSATAPVDSRFRVGWLERQRPNAAGADLRPQPWRHLIGVLRAMGRPDVAREVAIGRESYRRRAGRVGAAWPDALRPLARAGHALFGGVAGYGHRPWRLLGWMAVAGFGCAVAYGWAAAAGLLAPLDGAAPPFNAWSYSLERLVPLLDLGQQRAWRWSAAAAPDSATAAALMRGLAGVEVLVGWAGSATLVASLAGWFDRDRRA